MRATQKSPLELERGKIALKKKDSLVFGITAFMLLNLCWGQRFGSFTEKHIPM